MGLTSTCMCSTAQYVNKIETIFDDKRGKKRVKNQGISVRGNTHTHRLSPMHKCHPHQHFYKAKLSLLMEIPSF